MRVRTCGVCGKCEQTDTAGRSTFVQFMGDYCVECVYRAWREVRDAQEDKARSLNENAKEDKARRGA